MTKRPSTLVVCILLSLSTAFAQPTKERLFAETSKGVIDAFSNQDSSALAKFIDSKIGVYHLCRGNTFLSYIHLNTVSFSSPGRFVSQLIDCCNIHYFPLQYTALPKWLCDSEAWNKEGLFEDTTTIDHKISAGCKFKRKYQPEDVSLKTIHLFWDLELRSRRIVLQDDQSKENVFYLTYTNNKWYLTIIDKATSDCST